MDIIVTDIVPDPLCLKLQSIAVLAGLEVVIGMPPFVTPTANMATNEANPALVYCKFAYLFEVLEIRETMSDV